MCVRRARVGLLVLAALCAPAAGAADDERVARWAAALTSVYLSGGELPQPPADLDDAQAAQVRRAYAAGLLGRMGPVVGYKAALTSPAAQQRLGVRSPVYGLLLRDMLARAPAVVRPPGAARPLLEADLVVRVRSAALNDAGSTRAALAALDAALPFIELPALPYPARDARAFTAANAGAWRGVLGDPVHFTPGVDWARRLRDFEVVLADGDGRELGRGRGADLWGDPLAVVLWLRDALHAEGQRLAPGDLLSLGSLTPPLPAPWGAQVRATYRGLAPAPVAVEARLAARP